MKDPYRTIYDDADALQDELDALRNEALIAITPLLEWILKSTKPLHTKASHDYLKKSDEMT